METIDVEARIAALEARVRDLEDRLEILHLISTWGPAADIGDGGAASAIWTDDAVLETELGSIEGADGIGAMIDGKEQEALVQRGCAHVQGLPRVRIDGDRATAINYGRVYLHGDAGYEIWRVSANLWDFRRTGIGWRASRRRVHVIDGGPEARDLLREGIGEARG